MSASDKELKSFLRSATLAYAAGEYEMAEVSPHNYTARWEDGRYQMMDNWSTDAPEPQARIYSGQETVSRDSEEIWAAGYRGVIGDRFEPEDVLASYIKALRRPRPELPIRGPRSMRLGDGRVYRLSSVFGPLKVKDFAVEESIIQRGVRIYHGHIIGGTLESS